MDEWALGSNGWGQGYLGNHSTTSAFLTEAVLAFQQLWLFIIAPLVGGIAAALLWKGVFEPSN